MAGGRHTWQPHVTLGYVDVTPRLRGEVWHRQEESAAHLAKLRLALVGSDPDAEADAATGLTLVISIAWDGGAQSVRFAGVVQLADYDDTDQVLIVEASDRLQEWAEAQSEATIDAAVTGSKRVAEVQEARRDGWTQLLACLRTVRASYAIGRDGVHRLTAWAAGTSSASLAAGEVVWGGVRRVRRPLRDRVNRVTYRVRVQGARLWRWIIEAGWGAPETYCQWHADQWVLPTVAAIQQAVIGAGPCYHAAGTIGAGAGDAGGITYTFGPATPPSGFLSCSGAGVPYTQDKTVCHAAEWKWDLRSRQMVDFAYSLVVECEASQTAWGVLADERDATLNLSGVYAGWENSQAGQPSPGEWVSGGGGLTWITIDRAREIAVIESALAEGDQIIAASHRESLVIGALPWAVAGLDLHHTATYTGGTAPWVGVVSAIEETWNIATWEASTTIMLKRMVPLDEGDGDELTAPARPAIPITFNVTTDITFPVRRGGRTGAAEYSGDWVGVTSNYRTTDAAAPVYPYRARFVRPAVPDGARATITVNYAPTWRVLLGA